MSDVRKKLGKRDVTDLRTKLEGRYKRDVVPPIPPVDAVELPVVTAREIMRAVCLNSDAHEKEVRKILIGASAKFWRKGWLAGFHDAVAAGWESVAPLVKAAADLRRAMELPESGSNQAAIATIVRIVEEVRELETRGVLDAIERLAAGDE